MYTRSYVKLIQVEKMTCRNLEIFAPKNLNFVVATVRMRRSVFCARMERTAEMCTVQWRKRERVRMRCAEVQCTSIIIEKHGW